MTNPVKSKNLFQGPADIYVGDDDAVIPASTTSEPGAGWTGLGATIGGSKFNYAITSTDLVIDQSVFKAGAVITGVDFSIETNLAEGTLQNLVVSLGNGSVTDSVYTPADGTDSTQPKYTKVLMRGPRDQQNNKRDIVLARGFASEGLEINNSKETQGQFKTKWNGYYVDNTTPPFQISDKGTVTA